MPQYNKRYLRILSRHPSHKPLRKKYGGLLCPELVLLRLGSITQSKKKYQINTIQGILNSSDKYLMKKCFDSKNIPTAMWYSGFKFKKELESYIKFDSGNLEYPIVAKNRYGSRGKGNTYIDNISKFKNWMIGRDITNYIFEKYCSYAKEYRLHVTKYGCFYTNRKMLKSDAKERWYRNDSNSVWILDTNPLFTKPDSWDNIEKQCVAAIECVGLDIGACDVKVSKNGNFIILETNSAPSFGEITLQKYKEVIPKLILDLIK